MSRVASVCLAILLAATVARAQDEGMAIPDDGVVDAPTVEVRDERLTLDADQVPLGTILSRLATAAHIAFKLKGEASEPMSAHLVAVPLEDGLQWLLKNQNTLFVYEDQDSRTPSLVYVLGRRTGPPELPPTRQAENPDEAATEHGTTAGEPGPESVEGNAR